MHIIHELENSKLALGVFDDEDIPAFQRWYTPSLDNIHKDESPRVGASLNCGLEYIFRQLAAGGSIFPIHYMPGGTTVGYAGYNELDISSWSAEIFMFIGRPLAMGRNLEIDGLALILSHAFNVKDFTEVHFHMYGAEPRVIELTEAQGFRPTFLEHDVEGCDGEVYDKYTFSLTKDHWKAWKEILV